MKQEVRVNCYAYADGVNGGLIKRETADFSNDAAAIAYAAEFLKGLDAVNAVIISFNVGETRYVVDADEVKKASEEIAVMANAYEGLDNTDNAASKTAIETCDTVTADNVVKFEVGKTYKNFSDMIMTVTARKDKKITIEFNGETFKECKVVFVTDRNFGGTPIKFERISRLTKKYGRLEFSARNTFGAKAKVDDYAASVKVQDAAIEGEIANAASATTVTEIPTEKVITMADLEAQLEDVQARLYLANSCLNGSREYMNHIKGCIVDAYAEIAYYEDEVWNAYFKIEKAKTHIVELEAQAAAIQTEIIKINAPIHEVDAETDGSEDDVDIYDASNADDSDDEVDFDPAILNTLDTSVGEADIDDDELVDAADEKAVATISDKLATILDASIEMQMEAIRLGAYETANALPFVGKKLSREIKKFDVDKTYVGTLIRSTDEPPKMYIKFTKRTNQHMKFGDKRYKIHVEYNHEYVFVDNYIVYASDAVKDALESKHKFWEARDNAFAVMAKNEKLAHVATMGLIREAKNASEQELAENFAAESLLQYVNQTELVPAIAPLTFDLQQFSNDTEIVIAGGTATIDTAVTEVTLPDEDAAFDAKVKELSAKYRAKEAEIKALEVMLEEKRTELTAINDELDDNFDYLRQFMEETVKFKKRGIAGAMINILTARGTKYIWNAEQFESVYVDADFVNNAIKIRYLLGNTYRPIAEYHTAETFKAAITALAQAIKRGDAEFTFPNDTQAVDNNSDFTSTPADDTTPKKITAEEYRRVYAEYEDVLGGLYYKNRDTDKFEMAVETLYLKDFATQVARAFYRLNDNGKFVKVPDAVDKLKALEAKLVAMKVDSVA